MLTKAHHVTVRCVVDVKAPATQVWNALVDWESQNAWMLGTDVVVPSGAAREGVGSRIEAFTGAFPKRRWLGFLDTMTVTTWDPPRRCDVIHTGHLVRGTGAFEVIDLGSNKSRFDWSEELRLPLGLLGRVGWIFVGPVMMFGVRLSLRRFARYVERL
jgi:hypothetical protein